MKTRIYLFALLMMCSGLAVTTQASAKVENKEQAEIRVAQIQERVTQIKSMDLAHLQKAERTNLKHELKDMNKELRTMGPYVYISVGALIVIIILILLLL